MKLLSDFDGVWTNPVEEGVAQGELVDRGLVDGLADTEAARQWIVAARESTCVEPTRYGWQSQGRLSAFADEDPFICHSALLHYIEAHRDRDAMARFFADNLARQGFPSLDAFGGHSHAQAVAQVVREHGPGILPSAAASGRVLLDAGIEVVVVSNSTPEKLLHWFQHAGVPCTEHPQREARSLRVRGSARKFILGPPAHDPLRLGPHMIDIDRPSYEAILVDERPDVIVGDVFSLDLALPLALKRSRPGWEHVRLVWLQHPYTPEWLRHVIQEYAAGEIECVEEGLPGLTRLLTQVAPGSR